MSSKLTINNSNLKNSFELLDYRNEGELDIPTILENMTKLGFDRIHPELFDLIESLGEDKINYSDYDSTEYNDTKSILEKFILLTDNHYNKLKAEIDKQREERQKKKQLQQIFKGF